MYIRTWTAHNENEIIINMNHIVLVTYYPESNMSKIDTVNPGDPVWVDGNFLEALNCHTKIKMEE